jgi:type I restriction enzyme, S subunit
MAKEKHIATLDAEKIDISETHKEIVQEILREHLASTCHVWVFGSRATWLAKEYSDLDLAIARKDGTALSLTVMSAIETAFEDSLLPWKVDVIDLHSVNAEFRAAIERDKVLFSLGVGGEWKEVQLASYCSKIGSGATPRGGNQVYLDKGLVSLIRSQNIHNDGFKKNGLVYISEEDADKLKNVTVENNDVLLNITGDSVARVCNASKEFLPARVNQHVAIIRTTPSKLDPHFLRYILVSPSKQSLLLTLASAGATRNALTKNMIEKLTIQIPPLPEQKVIAHILGTLDDKIELNRQTNQTLEAMAQALFQSWFVDFDPVIDKALAAGNEIPEAFQAKAAARQALGDQRLALPADVTALFPDAFVFTEEMGWVPEGWEVGKITDISRLNPESWSTTNHPKKVTYVDLSNTKNGRVNETTEYDYSAAPSRAKRILRQDDTIIGTVRPGNRSYAYIHDEGLTGSTGFAVLQPRLKNYRSFIYLYLTQTEVIKNFAHLADGAAYPAIKPEVVGNQIIPKIDLHLMTIFDRKCYPLIQKIGEHQKQTKTLTTLRDTLLPKLISGDLRVADAEKFLGEVGV